MALNIYWVMAFDKTELKQLQELFKENNKAIAEAVSKGFEVMGEQIEGTRSEILGGSMISRKRLMLVLSEPTTLSIEKI